MIKTVVLGIHGKKGSGKTTICEIINRCHPFLFKTFSFADPLKPAIKVLFNWEGLDLVHGPDKETVDERWGVSPRQVLQHLGTDYLRHQYCDDFFVRNLKHRLEALKPSHVLLGDVRFPNEVAYIKGEDVIGAVWTVQRPGLANTDQHESEIALDSFNEWDEVIPNDSSLEELEKRVVDALTRLLLSISASEVTATSCDGLLEASYH